MIRGATIGLLSCLLGCGARSLPELDGGAQTLRLDDPIGFHDRAGYLRLVGAVRAPSSDPNIDQVEIRMRLGPGEVTSRLVDGRRVLVFPDGTRADRVEYVGRGPKRRIVDIRGTTLTAEGPLFHVLRPSAPNPNAPLFGARWSTSPDAEAAATQYIADMMAASAPWSSMPAPRREAEIESFRSKNNCLPCHAPDKPENTKPGEFGLVNRATDGSGFFTPYTVFADAVPLERYGAHDRTLEDPFVELLCAEGLVGDLDRRTCSNGEVPRARWDWARAWSTSPTHAKDRCSAAQGLSARMDGETTQAVSSFFDNCGR